MRTLIILFTLFPLSFAFGQESADSLAIAQAVNEQIWYPFQKAWAARDAEGFNALHADDVVRAGSWGIRVGAEYKENNQRAFASPNPEPRIIDFSFAMREFHPLVAYEVGYYRITMMPKDGPERVYYGYFHVVLRQQDGVWKIAQDWDADEVGGHKIGAEEFATGVPLSLQ
ncbi:MAG: nuclear transport factor 2 family protein [Bacteroidota bacterium]